MKVLYIGGFNLPDKNAAAQRVMAIAKLLRDLGHEVQLVGLGQALESFEHDGFNCINLPYPSNGRQWLKYLTSIHHYLPFLEQQPQLVIAYNHPALALKRLYEYGKKQGIKTLSDCTEWYEPQGNVFFKLIKGWDINQRMYRVHPRLDGIITISRFLDDFYVSKGMKTLLLPPLVDKREKKWTSELKPSDSVIRLLYAGAPAGSKDRLDFVINALSRIASTGRRFKLDIFGITEEQYKAAYLNGRNEQIPAFVDFMGRIPHESVIQQLRQADFQIFIRENHLANKAGFPTKFVETVSAGTIVLTNASSNLKDYMIEGVNSYELDISNEESLFNSLMKPLALSKDDIIKQKQTIDKEMFDYRKFMDITRAFLSSI
jgi:glycosyltransferase involved in cell wall biosynthesis